MHLVFWLYVVALMSGSASITVVLSVHAQQRRARQARPVVIWFAAFLGSLLFIVLSLALQHYGSIVESGLGVAIAALVAMIVGAGGYMAAAPFFYHALVGDSIGTGLRRLYLVIAGVFLLLAISVFRWPSYRPSLIALNLLLFGMIAYGIVFIAVRYRRIGDRRLRRAVRVFIVVSAVFFPLMYLDSMLTFLPPLPVVDAFDGTALPFFFLVLNLLSIGFTSTYLSEPAYLTDGEVSAWFRDAYGITDREAEIIGMVLDGHTNREIGEHLFIAPKTVENHVSSIYAKTTVRNRVELVNLIHEHRAR